MKGDKVPQVTLRMKDAGVAALDRYRDSFADSVLVEAVYTAMRGLEPRKGRVGSSRAGPAIRKQKCGSQAFQDRQRRLLE